MSNLKRRSGLPEVIEQLFDFYFVQPERAKARRETLNAKLQGAGKPPMNDDLT